MQINMRHSAWIFPDFFGFDIFLHNVYKIAENDTFPIYNSWNRGFFRVTIEDEFRMYF